MTAIIVPTRHERIIAVARRLDALERRIAALVLRRNAETITDKEAGR